MSMLFMSKYPAVPHGSTLGSETASPWPTDRERSSETLFDHTFFSERKLKKRTKADFHHQFAAAKGPSSEALAPAIPLTVSTAGGSQTITT